MKIILNSILFFSICPKIAKQQIWTPPQQRLFGNTKNIFKGLTIWKVRTWSHSNKINIIYIYIYRLVIINIQLYAKQFTSNRL